MAKRIRAIDAADFLDDHLDHVIKDVQKEQLKRIKKKTPVASGRARRGWRIKGHDIINKVSYVKFLEFGTRYMRPIAMVKTTALETEAIVKKVVAKIGDNK